MLGLLMMLGSTSVALAHNVPSIAAVAELELQNFKIYTNVK